ncbi:MAG: hypothetical protein ACLR1P_01865 [Oscillospiraceae bacterium]
MKRSILALVLALATVFALAACGRGDKAAAPVQPTADTAKRRRTSPFARRMTTARAAIFPSRCRPAGATIT